MFQFDDVFISPGFSSDTVSRRLVASVRKPYSGVGPSRDLKFKLGFEELVGSINKEAELKTHTHIRAFPARN